MRDRDHSLLSNATSLLICGVLAGVVVAAAAFPAVAVSGLAAKSGAEAFEKLPSELKDPPAPQITYVYASDAKTQLAMLYDENRRDVPITGVADVMQKAIIAAEDTRFYEHKGVDPKGVLRAFVANNNSGDDGEQQGASTLTMQYVRQSLQYNATTPQEVLAATVQTPARKLREIRYAMALEKKLTKQQILERYLNISYFGHGAYGIHAAAQVYFGKTPDKLTLAEASLIAGLVKSPSESDPSTKEGRKIAFERRTYVLDQMVKQKFVTQAQADEANKDVKKIEPSEPRGGCVNTKPNDAGFFCDYLITWWKEQPAFGTSPGEREDRLKRGGYTITTSLDLGLQKAAVDGLAAQIKNTNSFAIPMAAIEPGTGRVKAMAVNRTYSLDQTGNGASTNPDRKGQKGTYPNTTNKLISGGGDITGYQAGSTFKIFPLAAALDAGYPLAYTINAKSPYESGYWIDRSSKASCGAVSSDGNSRHYCPVNANPGWMNGNRTMWNGFGRSVNTFFIPLQEKVGADRAVKMAQDLGIKFRTEGDQNLAKPEHAKNWGAFSLGVSDTTPLDLANAYATLAAGGLRCEPTPVLEIKDLGGNKLDTANPRCTQAIKPEVANAAIDAARCPLGDQSYFKKCDGGTAQEVKQKLNRPVAGKTGTSDNTSASLVATTPQLSLAAIAADPDTHNRSATEMHEEVNAASIAALTAYHSDKPVKDFVPPTQLMAYGDQKPVPSVTCKTVGEAVGILQRAGFAAEVGGSASASACPAGTVAETSPTGQAPKGSTITLVLSAGPAATPPATPTQNGGGPGGGNGNGNGNGRGGTGGGGTGGGGGGGGIGGIGLPWPWGNDR
ncbi:penicillin-binding protein [Longispora albida]|uniref:penicillin-binding protein n=1 Tax=Longispora albida TaxID=203523 RepID=UPI00036D96D3|nr:penicillin-binding protein [Longispora albida]